MNLKKIEFPLLSAVKIVPVKGNTSVEIVTSGDVVISEPGANPKRMPNTLVARSIYGRLTQTPGGMNRSVKITLPTDMATRENFLLEVHSIFDNLFLEERYGI